MMIKSKLVITLLLLTGLNFQPLFAQESIIKEHFEISHDRKFVLYASTLRMLNIRNNQEYNEMVKGVDKLIIYTLDSATIANKSYTALGKDYLDLDFEEYAMANGATLNMAILGKEGKQNQFAGYLAMEDMTVAFYLRGNIAWQKIPALIRTFRQEDFFDILQF